MNNTLPNEKLIADILIVDDTPVNLQLLSSMLVETGYKVRQAVSGPQALRALEKVTPDLILLDIMMPDMTGYEVCKQIKDSEETKDIPVIFISALNDVFDKVLAFDVGGVDYITKPFRVPEVISRVQNQLTLHQQEKKIKAQYKHLQQKVSNLRIEEEDLCVYLHAIAQDLQNVNNHMTNTLKSVLKQTPHQVTEADTQHKNVANKQDSTLPSSPEFKISAKVIEQMIKNCDQQLNSIETITKLVNPAKLA
ncbi:MAG: response regulator [Leptolyngbya sp. SIO3F4]|nr:response regulator [Leptolyngbya sp. SIO3F4]